MPHIRASGTLLFSPVATVEIAWAIILNVCFLPRPTSSHSKTGAVLDGMASQAVCRAALVGCMKDSLDEKVANARQKNPPRSKIKTDVTMRLWIAQIAHDKMTLCRSEAYLIDSHQRWVHALIRAFSLFAQIVVKVARDVPSAKKAIAARAASVASGIAQMENYVEMRFGDVPKGEKDAFTPSE